MPGGPNPARLTAQFDRVQLGKAKQKARVLHTAINRQTRLPRAVYRVRKQSTGKPDRLTDRESKRHAMHGRDYRNQSWWPEHLRQIVVRGRDAQPRREPDREDAAPIAHRIHFADRPDPIAHDPAVLGQRRFSKPAQGVGAIMPHHALRHFVACLLILPGEIVDGPDHR